MKFLKKWSLLFAFAAVMTLAFVACGDDSSSATMPVLPKLTASDVVFEGFIVDSIDSDNHKIVTSVQQTYPDSIKLDCIEAILESSGGKTAYLATSMDENDPDVVDWDFPLQNGSVVSLKDTNIVSIVVLDEKNRVAAIWQIVTPKKEEKSSLSMESSSATSSSAEILSSETETSSSADSLSFAGESDEESSSSDSLLLSSEAAVSSSSNLTSSSGEEISSAAMLTSSSNKATSGSSESTSSSSMAISNSSEPASSSSKDASSSSVVLYSSSKTASSSSILTQSSSSEKPSSSSVRVSSSSYSSSSEVVVSSSSQNVSSSSEEVLPSSSSEELYSSSEESSSSEEVPLGVLLSDFGVATRDSSITITGTKIYVEVPYGTDLTAIKVLPMNTVADLTRPVEMEFVDASGTLQTYSVVAGMQLPGSDFNARVDSIWATTSDAMETVSDDIYKIGMVVDKVESKKNMFLSNGEMTVSSELVKASFIGIVGGKKLAGGFYYTGTYPKDNSAVHIYERGYTSGTPGTDDSDISLDMTFGKRFAARPSSFHVKYDYVHKKNKNDTQMGLIYVVLLAEDNKTIVASGAVKMTADESEEIDVDLTYGSDSGLMSSGYVGTSDLLTVNETKEVAYICVMFASSALAHEVASGESNYRGGEGSSLTISQFRLNY